MATPTISIIVPVYNTEKYLEKCLKSILDQSFHDFEVLCIDDGSTDESGAICDLFHEKDERYNIYHRKNSGVSSSRNFGLEHAKGKYIVFVDSDDYISPEHLECLYNGIKDHDTYSVCDYKVIDSEEYIKSKKDYKSSYILFNEENKDLIADCLLQGCFNYIWRGCFSKKIIEENKIRFRPTVDFGEDTIFVMEYLECVDGFSLTEEKSYYYRKNRNGSLSAVQKNHLYQDYLRISESICSTFEKKGILQGSVRSVIDHRIVYSALWCCQPLLFSDYYGKEEQKNLLREILDNKELKDAFSRSPQFIDEDEMFRPIAKGNVNELIRYWKKKTGQYSLKYIVKTHLLGINKAKKQSIKN